MRPAGERLDVERLRVLPVDPVANAAQQREIAEVLRRALASESASAATDCASLVEAQGGRVQVVEGDARLLKVTTPEHLALVESWLAA